MSGRRQIIGAHVVRTALGWAISHYKSCGPSSKHAEMSPESFGIFVCRSVGTVPGIWGLVWPSFRPEPGSKSKLSGRIRKRLPGPFGAGEKRQQLFLRIWSFIQTGKGWLRTELFDRLSWRGRAKAERQKSVVLAPLA